MNVGSMLSTSANCARMPMTSSTSTINGDDHDKLVGTIPKELASQLAR